MCHRSSNKCQGSNSNIPKFYILNSNIPEFYMKNSNIPEFYISNNNIPEFYTLNSITSEFYILDSNIPEFYILNSNIPEFYILNSNIPEFSTVYTCMCQGLGDIFQSKCARVWVIIFPEYMCHVLDNSVSRVKVPMHAYMHVSMYVHIGYTHVRKIDTDPNFWASIHQEDAILSV